MDQKPSSDGVKRGEVRVEDADFRWGGTADAAAATSGPNGAAPEANPLIDAAAEGNAAENNPNERGLTLRGVDLRMAPGTLTLVVGVTGGGKSSLLSALLGEIRRVKGRVRVGGSTAYCPQQAWCQNASLKDNIVFGDAGKDDARYGACIEACALGPDISSFPGGDGTEVGERGVTLSGGQQARVALARGLVRRCGRLPPRRSFQPSMRTSASTCSSPRSAAWWRAARPWSWRRTRCRWLYRARTRS